MKPSTDQSTESREERLNALCEALASLRDPQTMRRFLLDLCTPGELSDFGERWLIARLLHTGDYSYRDISALTGASTTTVARVARFLQQEPHQGYKTVLEKTKS